MKKYLLILILPLAFTGITQGQITKTGGSFSYNTGYYFNNEEFSDHKTGNPIISATVIYELSLPLHIKPSINIFIPNISKYEELEYSEKRVISAFSLDIDAHYVFNSLDRFELYGLAGVNILYCRMKYKYEFVGASDVVTSNDNGLGINIGAGTYFKLKDELDLYMELKAILGRQIQGVISAGILLNVDWMKKHEDTDL